MSKNFKKFTLLFFLLAQNFFSLQNSFADIDAGVERLRSCGDGNVESFDKFDLTKPNREMDFDFSNPTCAAIAAASYGAVKLGIAAMNGVCGTGSAVPRPFPSPIKDLVDLTKAANRARANQNCKLALTAASASFTTFISAFGITHSVAKNQYNAVRVCGSRWETPDKEKYMISKPCYKSFVKKMKYDDILSTASSSNIDACGYDTSITSNSNALNKIKKEFLYGGQEYEDNPPDGEEPCMDPITGERQKYYLRGLKPGNFLCEKYNPSLYNFDPATADAQKQKFTKAYQCCIGRSQNYICLDKTGFDTQIDTSDTIFCQVGKKCFFKRNSSVVFEAYGRDENRLICARSYSLCPYNFSVGGGSPFPDYYRDGKYDVNGDFMTFDSSEIETYKKNKNCQNYSEVRKDDCSFNEKIGKLKNYCQYFQHCTVANTRPIVLNIENINPYFSSACINFIGDSRNGTQGLNYDSGVVLGKLTNFTAPIVQCIKETMENIFYNRFGHSRCTDGTYGNLHSICSNGVTDTYIDFNGKLYKKGEKAFDRSFFEYIQLRLKSVSTLVLTLSVVVLGFKILSAKIQIKDRKDLMVYLFKFAFVVYFAQGTAWKHIFFDGVYNGSAEISRLFFKIKSYSSDSNPACNFGSKFNAATGEAIPTDITYPAGKSYLMVWDTLDCKIMQYLNYKDGFSSSTIATLIVASFFTPGIGIIFAFSVLILAFFLISIVIRAMHIFISSLIGIIIYVFVSPIIIPLVLFEKTKNIFDSWLSHIMSFTLQPMILFAYLGIFITLSESVLLGSATNVGTSINCNKYCVKADGTQLFTDSANDCGTGGTFLDPSKTSISCILQFDNFKKDNGFAIFGIGFPVLDGLFPNDSDAQQRLLLVLKGALFLYILAQFMDEIPNISYTLIGGDMIDANSLGYQKILNNFKSVVRGVQKRANRVIRGQASSAIGSASRHVSQNAKKGEGQKGGEGNGGGSKADDNLGGGDGGGDT